MDPKLVLWRQLGPKGISLEDEKAWPAQPFSLPLPSLALRETSSLGQLDAFFAIGEAWAQTVSLFLPPDPFVLDIGCGCGKLARFLCLNPNLRYKGVDLFLPAILWCRKAFGPLLGDRFQFDHFDGMSLVYNPDGKIKVSLYQLPCTDESVDMVVCASLFTHLLEPDCRHYLLEIRRVMKKGGKAIISIHTQPQFGELYSGDESRIDIARSSFIQLAAQAGLHLAQSLGNLYGQLALLFEVPV
jgi:SAM-dependent methyltransferase